MNKIKINGAKVIILSQLRVNDMSRADIIEHLNDVKHSVTPVRIHKIINELEASGYVTTSKAPRTIKRKASSSLKTHVMIVKISNKGREVIDAYLDTEISASIADIRERIAATITSEDKAKLEVNVKSLQKELAESIGETISDNDSSAQGLVINEFDKQQLIAIEKCCIEAMKWLNGN